MVWRHRRAARAECARGQGSDRASSPKAAVETGPPQWAPPAITRDTTEAQLQAYLSEIAGHASLPEVPYPVEPTFAPGASAARRLAVCQRFISSFEYNYTGESYVTLQKDRGMSRMVSLAREIIAKALPIQCIEAVFLAVYLTRDMKDLERFPISFKSRVNGHMYRHIVLAVRHKSKWGALGLSRKDTLMDKELIFDSLADLIWEYKQAYSTIWHVLVKVYIGLPFGFEAYSQTRIRWRVARVRVDCGEDYRGGAPAQGREWAHSARVINAYARMAPALADQYLSGGSVGDISPYIVSYKGTRKLGHAAPKRVLASHSTAALVSSALSAAGVLAKDTDTDWVGEE